ncbi:3075_t:CDS:2 [Funneliformis mosseae]|uniref:3075_t:CDS:1 n=1 Tax=Funneliformis mosseae TaxID=27381 RepID=A0A9N9G744_FUNMO|nr:3075_t:CDS:2 [Funneliformis mosseae]
MTSKISASPSEIHADDTKDKDFRKKGPLSDDTVRSESELLLDLGLINDDSLVSQGEKITKTITHDQITSLTIDVESSADNLTNQTARNNTNNAQIQLLRESFPKISHEQDKVQGLLQELSIPAKGEPEEENDSEEDGESISQNLIRLYKKYQFVESFEKRVKEIMNSNSRLNDQQART